MKNTDTKINPLTDVLRASGGFIFMPVFFEKLISRSRFRNLPILPHTLTVFTTPPLTA